MANDQKKMVDSITSMDEDFAKWYKRVCLGKYQKLVSVSGLLFFKRKYEISVNDLINYGKEVLEEN